MKHVEMSKLERAVRKIERWTCGVTLTDEGDGIGLVATDDQGTVALYMSPEQALEVAQLLFVTGVRMSRKRKGRRLAHQLMAASIVRQVRDAVEAG